MITLCVGICMPFDSAHLLQLVMNYEARILSTLEFRLHHVTAARFVPHFVRASKDMRAASTAALAVEVSEVSRMHSAKPIAVYCTGLYDYSSIAMHPLHYLASSSW